MKNPEKKMRDQQINAKIEKRKLFCLLYFVSFFCFLSTAFYAINFSFKDFVGFLMALCSNFMRFKTLERLLRPVERRGRLKLS